MTWKTRVERWYAGLLLTFAKCLNADARTTNRLAAALADQARKVAAPKGSG